MKKFSNNLLNFAKDSSYLLAANFSSLLFGMLTTIFLSRILSAYEYGHYRYIISFLSIFAIFCLPGMQVAITQGTARGFEHIFQKALLTRLKWSVLSSLSGLILSLYYFHTGVTNVAFGFLILTACCPLYFSMNGFIAYLQGQTRFKEILQSEFILYSSQSLMTITTAITTKNFKTVIFVYLVSYTAIKTFYGIKYLKELKRKKIVKIDISEEQSLIKFGKYLSLVKIINVFRAQYDKIFTGIYLGFYSLAVYSVAALFSEQFKMLNMVIGNAVLPRLSMYSKNKAYKTVKKYLIFYTLFIVLIAAAVIFLIPVILPLLFSAKYADSVKYAQLLMASMIIGSPPILISTLFESQKEKKRIWYLNNTVALFDILCISIFLPLYKLNGIVIARFISRTAATIFTMILFFRAYAHEKK